MGNAFERLRRLYSRFGPALIGQALNFVAMVIPVVAKQPGLSLIHI